MSHYVGFRQLVGIVSAFFEFIFDSVRGSKILQVSRTPGTRRLKIEYASTHSPVELYLSSGFPLADMLSNFLAYLDQIS